ncbi:phosphate ABC transporter substrate-binding protein PstS [Sporichthya sp.]|uniref:phosphate ABC transporter substrate-binding protein PstS n=1 Tax=Sporichthya sp. TaxID=65475 RepID=UPI00184DBA32|nr:phosphate ABC transporter substrate-binding protein PstS [Sporichthya sp.]MBA3742230.1 phosphate ABC transporter substrate-binding protein PstS [Sporichthya sp.]
MTLSTTRRPRRVAAAMVATVLCVGLSACADDSDDPIADSSDSSPSTSGSASPDSADSGTKLSGTLSGVGASSQGSAMEAWIAAFNEKYPDATINYEPTGSGAGREQFAAGAVKFAGSDAALSEEETTKAKSVCGDIVQVPLYVSPIAIAFNLPGITSLQLKAETIAKIFDGKITSWDDEAIKADNPDADLPGSDITPVHRSDKSGTTENFTDYLKGAAADSWSYDVSGDWPASGGEAAQGTSGVIAAIKSAEGGIGYADASQASGLGLVKVGVGSAFVEPSADAAAKILASSERAAGQGDASYAYELDRKTEDSGTYPVVLVTYSLACTQYASQGDVDLVKAFLSFIVSEEGQQIAEENAGSAPLSAEERDLFQAAIDKISLKS